MSAVKPNLQGAFSGPSLESTAGIGALTLPGFLDEVTQRFSESEAIVFDDPLRDGETVRWSYRDLATNARKIAKSLLAAGVKRGDSVAIVMGNRPEAVAAIFGAGIVGAIAVPMSTFAPAPELAHMLRKSSAPVVLTQRQLLDRHFAADIESIRDQLPSLRTVAVIGEASWNTFLDAGASVPDSDIDSIQETVTPDDPALVIFSSGTTSEPKGILHGHRSPSLQFWIQSQLFARHASTRTFSALPIFWTAGLNTAVGSTLASGGCWVAQEVFEPGEALRLISRERVTEPYTLAHQTAALAEHADWESTDLSSVKCAYGKGAFARHATVTPDPNWVMPVGYGLSETCAFATSYRSSDSREQVRIGSGRVLPGVHIRVVDPDTERVLGVDEEGELVVAGATLMHGYLGRPADQTFDADGYFHTGDAGHVDVNGIVHYSGRRTEMIKTGGANVSPAELEVALRACAPVKLSRILGIADKRLDQIVVACIVCKEGFSATEEEIKAFLKERVASYKVPKHVLFFDEAEVPMTAGGTKVRDEGLVEKILEKLGRNGGEQ
jgi:fatty-acyl-CoA synthase